MIVHHGNHRFTRTRTACGEPKSYYDRTSVNLVTCTKCIQAILLRHNKLHKDGWKHKKYELWLKRLDELNGVIHEPIIDFQI